MTLRLFQAENSVFGKTMKNKRKQRYQTFNKERRTELSYHKDFIKNVMAIEMTKTQVLMNKPVYLRLSILELSKIAMYEFW